MSFSVFVFDPTISDPLSQVRGVGRYLQILKENFGESWIFTDDLSTMKQGNNVTIFINPFFNFLQPPLTLKRIAKKQVAIIHDLIPLKYPTHFPIGWRGRVNVFLNKLTLKNYDLIITDSQASKKNIIQILGIDENKVKVIYPCLPKIFTEFKLKTQNSKLKTKAQISKLNKDKKDKLKDLRSGFEISDFRFNIDNYCLYVGDATWNKNLVNLAKAIKIANVTCVFVGKVFEDLKIEDRNWKLDFEDKNSKLENQASQFKHRNLTSIIKPLSSKFPHPWQKELRQFIEETKDDRRFVFAGFVPDSQLIKLYQQARCNLLLSHDEGFGFSFLEAASQKCPSVLSDIPVFREIAADTAWFANPTDPYDIANKIGEIYFHPKLQNQLGEQAKKRVKNFSQKKFKEEFSQLLNY